jgi:hypothetical protein
VPLAPIDQVWVNEGGRWHQMSKGEADQKGLPYQLKPPAGASTSGYSQQQGGDGQGVQLVSAVSPMGGPGFSMDMLMHPARYAMREAMARGEIPGPPWAQQTASAMAASQPPANVPPGAQAGPQAANFVSMVTNNNGVLQGKEDGSKFITGAQVQRSGWHPSMQVV